MLLAVGSARLNTRTVRSSQAVASWVPSGDQDRPVTWQGAGHRRWLAGHQHAWEGRRQRAGAGHRAACAGQVSTHTHLCGVAFQAGDEELGGGVPVLVLPV